MMKNVQQKNCNEKLGKNVGPASWSYLNVLGSLSLGVGTQVLGPSLIFWDFGSWILGPGLHFSGVPFDDI